MATSQIRAYEITQPPSDQGSIVFNAYEDRELHNRRRDGNTIPKFDIDDPAIGTYLVAQNELVFCDANDKRIPKTVGSASVGPWIWSSFNKIDRDTKPVFLGVADHTSKNYDPSATVTKSIIPVCAGGLRAIHNNSEHHVYPGDLIMWDYPTVINNNGAYVSLLRHRIGPKAKFTAATIPVKTTGDGLYDVSNIVFNGGSGLGDFATILRNKIGASIGLVAELIGGGTNVGTLQGLGSALNPERDVDDITDGMRGGDREGVANMLLQDILLAVSEYQDIIHERIIGKATNAAGPGQIIHVLLK